MDIVLNGVTLQGDYMDADFMEVFEAAMREVITTAEAAKQSRRGIVPEVCVPVSFERATQMAAELELSIIPYEEERRLPIREFLRGKAAAEIGIFIGPEGGFDEGEIELAKARGITPVTLGPRILRTETAGLVTAALALYELGEMN